MHCSLSAIRPTDKELSRTAETTHNNLNLTIMMPHNFATNKAIDAVMALELNALTPKLRNTVLEEIHCVKSMAVQETPELVNHALGKLRHEASGLIANGGGNGYYVDALEIDTPYVQSRDFGLKFLRADLFNVNLAVKRMLNHLDLLFKFFGPLALQRPLRLSDLTKEERICLRKGSFQIMPYRDKAGRLILIFQRSMEHVSHVQRVRHACESIQRKSFFLMDGVRRQMNP